MDEKTVQTTADAEQIGRRVRIDYMPLSDLRQRVWDRNPKGHNLRQLRTAFERFGFVSPGIINETNGKLLAGHGRLDVLIEGHDGGAKPPDGVIIGEGREWLVPVIRGVHLAEGEHGAYAIADNKLVESGGWDNEKLGIVLAEVMELEGLEGTGFSYEAAQELIDLSADARADAGAQEQRPERADMALLPYEHYDYIVLLFRDQREWERAVGRFKIKKVDYSHAGKTGTKRIGLGRVIEGKIVLDMIEGVVDEKKQAPL